MTPDDDRDDIEFDADTDYDSPYPIGDRHVIDSIYNLVMKDHNQVEEWAKAYKTAKLVVNLILFGLLVSLFALIMIALTGMHHE